MIFEVRTYALKAGQRAEFLNLFQKRSMPIHERIGMLIIGPLLDLEHPDVFVFFRAFPSLDERDRMKAAFYDGPEWKIELGPRDADERSVQRRVDRGCVDAAVARS